MSEFIVRVVIEASPSLVSLLERLSGGVNIDATALPQPVPVQLVEDVKKNAIKPAPPEKKPSPAPGKMTPERKQVIANMRQNGRRWREIFVAVNELPGEKFSSSNSLSSWTLQLIKSGALPPAEGKAPDVAPEPQRAVYEKTAAPTAVSPDVMAPVVRALQKGAVDEEHAVKMSPRDILTWARNNRIDVTTGTEDEILQRINRMRKNMQLPPFAVDPWLRSEL